MVESSVEASMVFEKLFSDYLKSHDDTVDSALLRRRMTFLKVSFPILNEVETAADGKVSINLGKGDIASKIMMLSKAFDGLIDVIAYRRGSKMAFKEAERVVLNVQKQFEGPFTRLNLGDHLLKGALRAKLTTGTPGMDEVLGGGIPLKNMVLVFGPPGKEKHQFTLQFLAEGLKMGGSGLAIVTALSVDELRAKVQKCGVDVSTSEDRGLLKIIDWYTQKSKAIVGMEENGSVSVPSKDIANLDIAIGTAVSRFAFAPTKRAIVDFISPALSMYDLSDVVEFIQREKTRLKKEGFTALFLVEHGAHNERVISTLKHLSDGVVSIIKEPGGKLFVEVESMSGTRFKGERFALQMSARGLSVVGETVDELGVMADFVQIRSIDMETARRLMDSGFTDLETLYNATEDDLMSVEGMTADMAKNIKDYTGTIEFSRQMLSKKSEKWLRKGVEQLQAGDIGKARKSIERALEIDPNNAGALLELSRLAGLEGNSAQSQEHYKKAVTMNPELAKRWGGDSATDDGGEED